MKQRYAGIFSGKPGSVSSIQDRFSFYIYGQNHSSLISRASISYPGEWMSKRAVDMTFQAIYTLTDLRILLRETAPFHEFDADQKAQVQRLLENLERQVGSLKQEMLK
jgi:hypothetical protein